MKRIATALLTALIAYSSTHAQQTKVQLSTEIANKSMAPEGFVSADEPVNHSSLDISHGVYFGGLWTRYILDKNEFHEVDAIAGVQGNLGPFSWSAAYQVWMYPPAESHTADHNLVGRVDYVGPIEVMARFKGAITDGPENLVDENRLDLGFSKGFELAKGDRYHVSVRPSVSTVFNNRFGLHGTGFVRGGGSLDWKVGNVAVYISGGKQFSVDHEIADQLYGAVGVSTEF